MRRIFCKPPVKRDTGRRAAKPVWFGGANSAIGTPYQSLSAGVAGSYLYLVVYGIPRDAINSTSAINLRHKETSVVGSRTDRGIGRCCSSCRLPATVTSKSSRVQIGHVPAVAVGYDGVHRHEVGRRAERPADRAGRPREVSPEQGPPCARGAAVT